MPVIIDGTNGITQAGEFNSDSSFGFKNRFINGQMTFDQRNAGASVTPTNGQFSVDRWAAELSQSSKFSFQQNAGAVTPPVGFTDYLGVTSLSAYTVGSGEVFNIYQRIEGFNVADLGWGTANAKTVTLSFWVRSPLTGTFGGAIQNSANNRSYPFSYTINAANTFEYKTVTVDGDTSGTWLTTNGNGMAVRFSLGAGATYSGTAGAWAGSDFRSATGATSVVGTNGATFFITGVQLEVGSTATNFDVRSIGTELALAQRYYYKFKSTGSGVDYALGYALSSTGFRDITAFPVTMRTVPSSLEQTGTASDYSIRAPAGTVTCSAVPFYYGGTANVALTEYTVSSGLTTGQGSSSRFANSNAYVAWSAEL